MNTNMEHISKDMEDIGIVRPEKKSGAHDRTVNILAVIGLIAVVSLGIWGIVGLGRSVAGIIPTEDAFLAVTLRALFPADNAIEASVSDATIESADDITLSFTHEGGENGMYALSYACVDGVRFEMVEGDGTARGFDCASVENTPAIDTESEEKNVRLRAYSDNNRFADASLSVIFTPGNGGERVVSDPVSLTIFNADVSNSRGALAENEGAEEAEPEQIGGNTTAPGTQTGGTFAPVRGEESNRTYTYGGGASAGTAISDPFGDIDLTVRILETGILNENNIFVPKSPIAKTDHGAVRFEIVNVGTKNSGAWTFSASLPTDPGHLFSSDPQVSLSPGERIEFTIGFDRVEDGPTGTISITADAKGELADVNRGNNGVNQTIDIVE